MKKDRTKDTGKRKHGQPAEPLSSKDYEHELRKLQAQLCELQDWVRHKGLRVVIVFEGRDAAGKGGVIRAITERVSPRVFRVVALPAPSDREKTQLHAQRYIAHLPAAGEVVIFDRSWYNRAGVERVLGFCKPAETREFLEHCPAFERYLVENGIKLIKVWMEVGMEEQERRLAARLRDPLRQWKLSPTDLYSRSRWYEYSRARDDMLEATDTRHAPWRLVHSDDKRRARLNVISHILAEIDHKKVKREKITLPEPDLRNAYDDLATLKDRRFILERY